MVEEYAFCETVYSHEGEYKYDDSALACSYTSMQPYCCIVKLVEANNYTYLIKMALVHTFIIIIMCICLTNGALHYFTSQFAKLIVCKIYCVCNVVSN